MTTTSSEAARAALKAAIIEYQAQTPGLREGSITTNLEARGFAILPIPRVGEGAVERAARAIFDDLRGRSGIKHFILHHEELPHEAGFEDNRFWLMETARGALATLSPSPGAGWVLVPREPTEAMIDRIVTGCLWADLNYLSAREGAAAGWRGALEEGSAPPLPRRTRGGGGGDERTSELPVLRRH